MEAISGLIASFLDVITRVFITSDRYLLWLTGFRNTLIITSLALVLGQVIGFFVTIIRVIHDDMKTPLKKPNMILRILNRIVKLYVTVIRGIPMMVQLMIMNFIILAATRNALLVGIIAFGINSGSYVSEVFRGGVLSVDKGQMEAGRSLGLSYRQTMLKIITPQAIKNCLPAMGNEFITLLKETSISGIIAVIDITRAGAVIRGVTYDPMPLIFVAAFYLIMVLFLEFLVRRMERRLRRSDQR